MITITIDCGASFIKGAAFADGQQIREMRRTSPEVHGSQSLLSPKQIKPLVRLVRQMVIELADGEREAEFSISNEMHGFILTCADGEPYTDYISWQKEYGSIPIDGVSSVQMLEKQERLREEISYTGMPLRGGLPSCNLLYLSRNGQMAKEVGQLRFYTLGSYLLRALSGKEPAEHPTNAAATGLYDLQKNGWSWKYIEEVCGSGVIFPRIGQERMEFALDGVQICALPALGDQQAALLGADVVRDTDISFNLGTGAQVSCLADTPDYGVGYQIRPYFGGKYLKTIPHIPSGRALNVYFRLIQSVLKQYGFALDQDRIWAGIVEAAAGSEVPGPKIDLSFFENAVTSSTKGSITQIEEHSLTMQSLMCSVQQTMAENFISAANQIKPNVSEIKQLIFSGGVARKFERLREKIAAHYPKANVSVASNETLVGLYRYAKMDGNQNITMERM